ncbi:MAG: hypothetical protein AABY11_01125, partial [archaeon]
RMSVPDIIYENEEYKRAFGEFKRFVALSIIHQQPIGMVSPRVDAVWHEFILHTREYVDFCNTVVGNYFHHAPATEAEESADSAKTFHQLYQQTFGEPFQFEKKLSTCSGDCSSACRVTACYGAPTRGNTATCNGGPDDGGGSKCSSGPDSSYGNNPD